MRWVANILLVCLALLIVACQPQRPPSPQLTQLQARQLQTREFPNETVLATMKAIAAALQDDGFTIGQANPELGLITAEKQISDEDTATKNSQLFWYGSPGLEYRAVREWDATVSVQEIDEKIVIRASFIEKGINNKGGVIYSEPVTNAQFYQDFFAKIDKSVFLQKNKL